MCNVIYCSILGAGRPARAPRLLPQRAPSPRSVECVANRTEPVGGVLSMLFKLLLRDYDWKTRFAAKVSASVFFILLAGTLARTRSATS